MLPYATNEDVIKICKELIKEGGSQPQPSPEPTPSIKPYDFDEIKEHLESFYNDEITEFPVYDDTYSLEGLTVANIFELWEALDPENVELLISLMSGEGETLSGEHGRLEVIYDMTANTFSDKGFRSGPLALNVNIEEDTETGSPLVVIGLEGGDSLSSFIHGTLHIKSIPAN